MSSRHLNAILRISKFSNLDRVFLIFDFKLVESNKAWALIVSFVWLVSAWLPVFIFSTLWKLFNNFILFAKLSFRYWVVLLSLSRLNFISTNHRPPLPRVWIISTNRRPLWLLSSSILSFYCDLISLETRLWNFEIKFWKSFQPRCPGKLVRR